MAALVERELGNARQAAELFHKVKAESKVPLQPSASREHAVLFSFFLFSGFFFLRLARETVQVSTSGRHVVEGGA